MWRQIAFWATSILLAGLFAVTQTSALAVPPAPTLEVPIVDQTKTLSEDQIEKLAQQIITSRGEKSYQVGILIVPSLGNDEYLEGYSIKVAREWGVGDKSDNGVLILIVMDSRDIRLEVGRGLEGDIPDALSGRIIRNVMSPKFKQGDYFGGLSGAINSIGLAVSKQADPSLGSELSDDDWAGIIFTIIFIGGALLSWLGAILGRSKSWWAGGVIGGVIGVVLMLIFAWAFWTFLVTAASVVLGLLFDFVVSRNYKVHKASHTSPSWWAGGGGWGSGGFGGGGGGSFGGGGFSGGGASGGW